MRIVHFTDPQDLESWASARGIRRLLAADARFIRKTVGFADFPRAGIRSDDLILVGGGGMLEKRHEAFWRWLSELKLIPVVLWGIGASGASGLDPAIALKLRPRILLAGVRDDLTNGIYGFRGHVSFSPAVALLNGRAGKAGQKVLFADRPGFLDGEGSRLIASACDSRTVRSVRPGILGFGSVLSLFRRSRLVVCSGAGDAVVSDSLGIPWIGFSTDGSAAEHHRKYGGGVLVETAAEAAEAVKKFRAGSLTPPEADIDAPKIAEFVDKFRKVIYESRTPVDLGSIAVRG